MLSKAITIGSEHCSRLLDVQVLELLLLNELGTVIGLRLLLDFEDLVIFGGNILNFRPIPRFFFRILLNLDL